MSAYTTAQMGREETILDNGVVWVIYPKLWKYVFTEGEPMPPERRVRLLEMKAKRNEQEQSE